MSWVALRVLCTQGEITNSALFHGVPENLLKTFFCAICALLVSQTNSSSSCMHQFIVSCCFIGLSFYKRPKMSLCSRQLFWHNARVINSQCLCHWPMHQLILYTYRQNETHLALQSITTNVTAGDDTTVYFEVRKWIRDNISLLPGRRLDP